MTAPVFLVINATPNLKEETARNTYLEKAKPISARHGAVPIANYLLTESLSDGSVPAACAVISFPTKESIHQLFADPDYQEIIEFRDQGFDSINYFIGTEQVASN